MVNIKTSLGVVHRIPADLKKELISKKKVYDAWEDITPLAKNEFICWIISAKKGRTRMERIKRTYEDLLNGKRRPCCWPGCPHRSKDKKSIH